MAKNMEQLFEVEVTLPYHLWGIKFLACLEWFQHIQAKSWQGHQPVSLGPFPLHCPQCHLDSLLSSSHSLKKKEKKFFLFYFFIFYLFTNATSGLRGPLVLVAKKSIAITGGNEKQRERERTCSRGRETGCYPCQSDPAWRLSSPLIALLISSPLSLDLGQQGPSAGAD